MYSFSISVSLDFEMLSTLHIKNIGIIDDLSINFEEGFNVLTGETGAGKTLIIGSLAILSGGRFSKEMIRKGEECSLIEASIFVPQSEFSEDGNIIISREVYSNGRNTCKINGNLVTVSELKRVMSKIIDIHGQHDNQNLLDSTKHIVYLDGFIGDELFNVKHKYQEYFNKYNEIKNKLKNNYGDETEKTRRLDLLRYQYNEIDVANLKIGEDLELEEKHNIMMNSEKLKENLEEIDENINSNAIEYISNSIRCLEKIEDYGEIYKSKLAELKSIYYELQETARDLSSLKDEANFDEYERDEVERRLDIIFSLKRKYGNGIEEILEYKNKLAEEIEQIENVEEINKKLKMEQKEIESKMNNLCNLMNEKREKYGIILSEKIKQEYEAKSVIVQQQIMEAISQIKQIERQSDKKVSEWQSNVALLTVNAHINYIKSKYKRNKKINQFLNDVKQDVLKNVSYFLEEDKDKKQNSTSHKIQCKEKLEIHS